jgi:hypothetical protein
MVQVIGSICAEIGDPVDWERYQRIVGRLIYLCHVRPDIAYAVNVVSMYMHDHRTRHLEVVYQILRYLKGTLGKGLWFITNQHLHLEQIAAARRFDTLPH